MGKRFLRYVLLSLFSCTLFANSPSDFSLASVYNEPSVFVEGKVNAITGELVDLEEDLVIQGAEPIRIHRVYLNSSRQDWIFLPHGNAIVDFSEGHQNCTIRETTGCPIRYKQVSKTKNHGHLIYRYEPSNLEEGFSNTSGCTSLKNNYAIYDQEMHQLTLYTADGVERIYQKRRKRDDGDKKESWRLLSEHLPNGNWLLYDYIKMNEKYSGPIFALSSIRSMNPSQTKQYAEARFLHEDPKGKNKHFFIEGSDGQKLEYRFDIGSGIAVGSIVPFYQEAKLAMQAVRSVKNIREMSAPVFAFKSTPIPKQIHKMNPVVSIPRENSNAIWHRMSPFKNKSAEELHEMFLKKKFDPIGKDSKKGLGNYINPRNGRQYHIDPQSLGRYREPNHVDVSRLEENLNKRKFRYLDD